jgi:signal transduction histidine kinase
MHARVSALWPAAFAFGLLAELAGRPPLPALDAAAGFSLLGLGLLAWRRQPRYAVGWILAAAGTAWFAGTIASWAALLHRAPIAQLIVTYPARRLWPASPTERLAVVAAYSYAIALSLSASDAATVVFAIAVLGFAVWRYLASRGLEHRARASAIAAAAAFATVLITATIERLAGAGAARGLLVAYELVVILAAAGLTVDLVWGQWSQGLLAAFLVDLGEPTATGALRARLARVLGDPTLTVGYWVPDQNRYVDETGQPLTLPANEDRRAVQLIDDHDLPLAALIHDPATVEDPALLADITAATRVAVANARLQAEIRTRLQQVEVSRRRLLEAADEQRRQLEHELREGAEQRLAAVGELLSAGGPQLAALTAGVDDTRAALRELARGIHPATLTDAGLHAALNELAARSPVPVQLTAHACRLPPAIEAATYFLCSEALANVAKYAQASRVRIQLTGDDQHLRIDIDDDGIGGADPSRGSGLRGLEGP